MRLRNEDNFLIRELDNDGSLLAVADGIGGGPGGELASQMALTMLDTAIGIHVSDVSRMAAAVSFANRKIFDEGQKDPELAGMGTTLTGAALFRERIFIVHVGDSRAYRLSGDSISRLTADHSVVGEMERAGSLTREEADHHPQRNVLTRAVGPYETVTVDNFEGAWHDADRLLLCTDGLFSVMSDAEILSLSQQYHGETLVTKLVEEALARGGPDNVTLVLAEFDPIVGDGNGG